ncbi:hypothetical protein LCO01nite_13660 [Lapidilactobacillus concavus]|nr:hypothetical protein LCO01nite_13660 [Lapidilactobacillus concavus]
MTPSLYLYMNIYSYVFGVYIIASLFLKCNVFTHLFKIKKPEALFQIKKVPRVSIFLNRGSIV